MNTASDRSFVTFSTFYLKICLIQVKKMKTDINPLEYQCSINFLHTFLQLRVY